MISRYSRKEMTAIWQEDNKYKIWLMIEAYAAMAMEELGLVPHGVGENILSNGKVSPEQIDEIEKTTKHDVIAFLTNLADSIGEDSRFVHLGMTSSDLLDTCLSYQLKQASDILLNDLDQLLAALKTKAYETKDIVTIGRSHGIHAEPTSFGLKFASFYAEFTRARVRLVHAREEIAVCAISGAVGSFANVDPFVQDFVATKLGLSSESISTQVIPRDRHAAFFAALALIASSIERLAIEIRHLQRTEVLEAEEYFSKGQKGSSAMPHKRNPVLSENITGLARIVRAAVIPAMENVALWHERDISHSSVERMIAPDTTITLDFVIARATNIVSQLVIHPQNIERNLNQLKGLPFSQRVLLTLIEDAGISRELAYSKVQAIAMKIWNNESEKDFLELLLDDAEIKDLLGEEKLKSLFDNKYHIKNANHIFARVFGNN